VEILANLKPLCVAPGHGSAMRGPDLAPALDELAKNFDVVARPKNAQRAA
jgi:hypothetical protein